MRLFASSLLSVGLMLVFLTTTHTAIQAQTVDQLASSTEEANRTCNCPDPPGGSISCEKGLVPICIVKDGRIISMCKAFIGSVNTKELMMADILSLILDRTVTAADIRENSTYQSIFRLGGLKIPGASFTFQLPGEAEVRLSTQDIPSITDAGAITEVNKFVRYREGTINSYILKPEMFRLDNYNVPLTTPQITLPDNSHTQRIATPTNAPPQSNTP